MLKQYFDPVSEEDRLLANELLQKIKIISDCQYDFNCVLHFDTYDLPIEQSLKRVAKGKRIAVNVYTALLEIQQELLTNNSDNKYNDTAFNNYLLEIMNLFERNLCDI